MYNKIIFETAHFYKSILSKKKKKKWEIDQSNAIRIYIKLDEQKK